MSPIEATVLVIVTAPAYGSLLCFLVECLSRENPAPGAGARRPWRDSSPRPEGGGISVSLWRPRGPCRWSRAPGRADAALIAVSAAGIALWSLFTDAPSAPSVLLGWTLLVLSVIDWRELLLPDALTLPLIAAGLAVAAVFGSWPDHLAGAAAGAASLMLVGSAFGRISGREGLGMGDVKLFAAGGAWTGWQALPGILLVAALLGLAYAAMNGRLGEERDRPIAFGPFLAAGIWVSWLYGPLSR